MKHTILIVSPTPTHPLNAGNRSRIFTYSKYLMELGHEVHFLYSDQEDADLDAMVRYWGERFHHVSYKAPVKRGYNRYLMKINPNLKYYSHIDDHYNEWLDEKIAAIKQAVPVTAVVAEYIFNTRAFFNFGPEVLKVVDTHDVMTDRHKHFLRAGKPPIWYSTSRREEAAGINRADVVMAIQEVEAAFYRKLTRRKVITVGHMVDVVPSEPAPRPAHRLLFVGSDNPSNYHAMVDFIRDYFPVIKSSFPDMELILAGKICRVIDDHEGVVKLGEVEDLAAAYGRADIVLNPLTIGTGLKIKMIEALGFGKAVISTPVGAEGLEEGAGKSYLLAGTPDQFARQLNRLVEEPGCFNNLVKNAYDFVNQYNNKPKEALARLFG